MPAASSWVGLSPCSARVPGPADRRLASIGGSTGPLAPSDRPPPARLAPRLSPPHPRGTFLSRCSKLTR